MFVCMIFQTVNPAVSNSITELFLLPVQNVLHFTIKDENLLAKANQIAGITKFLVRVPLVDKGSSHHQRHCVTPISQSFPSQA